MVLQPLSSIPGPLPESLRSLAKTCRVYDSSCGDQARVYYLEADGGLFLKTAEPGTLRAEAEMTRYFHSRHLAPEVLLYESRERDYLLTRKLPGRDCIHPNHLAQPDKLCNTLGQALRLLHSVSAADCPVKLTGQLLQRADSLPTDSCFRPDLSIPGCYFASAGEARQVLTEMGPFLRSDTLIHGDFCLPNVIVQDWKLSGLIDVGGGGLGDRHLDLFWGIWSLQFNLKTPAYTDRFLDAYGRDGFEPELLRAAAALEAFG